MQVPHSPCFETNTVTSASARGQGLLDHPQFLPKRQDSSQSGWEGERKGRQEGREGGKEEGRKRGAKREKKNLSWKGYNNIVLSKLSVHELFQCLIC